MNCNRIQPLLSEFIDGRLSARETWEIDRHIAICNVCANFHTELKMTVIAVQCAEIYSVSDNFAAILQSRLATVNPKCSRSFWLSNLLEMMRPFLRPSPQMGYGVCALAILVLLPLQFRSEQISPLVATQHDTVFVHASRTHAIAITATDPFGDTAATSMAASNQMEVEGNSSTDSPI